MLLRALKSTADNQHTGATLTWDALNRAGQQYGTPDIDYDRFAARFDSDPVLQGMIDNFDQNGIVLKTQQGSQQPQQGGQQEPGTGGTMAAMASHATQMGK